MHQHLRLLTCFTAAAALCAQAQQGAGGFQVIGPGGGGAMFHPAISPHDPKTALVACDMTGSYITHDGGHTWRMFNLRAPVRFFVFDPLQSRVMYAETSVLWRSTDNGETWKLVQPAPSQVEDIAMASDHGDETVVAAADPLGEISALAVAPDNSKILYAASTKDGAALFRSTDAGLHWTRMDALPEPASRLWLTGPHASTLLAITAHHLVRVDAHSSAAVPKTLPGETVDASFGIDAQAASVLYRVTDGGLTVSRDGGSTWTTSTLPGTGSHLRAVAASLHRGSTAYVSYSGLKLNGREWHGVARTDDAGQSWRLVWQEGNEPAPNVHDAWITARFGTTWGENPIALGVAEQDAGLVYGTDYGRTLISRDGGANWDAAYSRRTASGDWTSTGLNVTTAYGIHFDPLDARHMFITYTDIGAFRSDDGGHSWTSATIGVPRQWLNTTYWMVFDPKVKGRAWSVNSGTHDLPRPKMWRHTPTDSYLGGVCETNDGGRTWAPSSTGLPQMAATDIVLDPTSPADARVLYVTGFGHGVYKTADGGRTWTQKNAGIVQPSPMAWRLTRAQDGTLYLVVARRSEDGSIGNPGDGALYVSRDRAETWQPVALPQGVNGPNGVAADPLHPHRLYLAAWTRSKGTRGEGGGVYRSDDDGAHWTTSLDRDQHIYDVTVDPRVPGTVYAAGFESSAWVSRDNGAHWARISGFNFKWAHRVVLDPADAHSVYITTFGGSVWHGPVRTAPLTLDIATPRMEPHL